MRIARFRLTYWADQQLELPRYKAGTFRGTFGHIFRRVACPNPEAPAEIKAHRDDCIYARCFLAKSSTKSPLPPPYIIEDLTGSKEVYRPGEEFNVGLVLVGEAIHATPYFLRAFELLGAQGLGKGQKQVTLVEVENFSNDETGENALLKSRDGTVDLEKGIMFTNTTDLPTREVSRITLRTKSPVYLQHRGEPVVGAIPFPLLLKNLTRRYTMLMHYKSDGEKESLESMSSSGNPVVTIEDYQLQWTQVKHWSNRQGKYNSISGLEGWITYQGELAPWSPLLQVGQWLHVGKKTSFGLGQYELEYKTA